MVSVLAVIHELLLSMCGKQNQIELHNLSSKAEVIYT
jgi:hypothetical protein